MIVLFSLLFAQSINDLGSINFAIREQASVTLAKYWPISEPALSYARVAADPEIRRRAKRATPVEWYDFITIHYARYHAIKLITHTNPDYNSLPWANKLYAESVGAREDVRRELSLLVDELHLRLNDDIFMFESWKIPNIPIQMLNKYPLGLDHLRFRARYIKSAWHPFWDQELIMVMTNEWSDIKKK